MKKLEIDHITTAEMLGVALKRHRKLKGLSQSDLATIVNMHQPTISEIERGKGNIDSLLRIIQALKLNFSIASEGKESPVDEDVENAISLLFGDS